MLCGLMSGWMHVGTLLADLISDSCALGQLWIEFGMQKSQYSYVLRCSKSPRQAAVWQIKTLWPVPLRCVHCLAVLALLQDEWISRSE